MSQSSLILLVEREGDTLSRQETVLRRKDRVVTRTGSGQEAIELIARERPSLVIFGFDLGDMTGPEFCRHVRSDEVSRGVSLLFISRKDDESNIDLCMAAGCNDILLLPFEQKDLDVKVEKLTFIPTRRTLRTLTKIEVKMQNGGSFMLGHSVNISATGMLVELDRVLPPNAGLRLHFYLRGEVTPMQLAAEITRADFSGACPRYGLKFLSVTQAERTRINLFVSRLRARELL